MLMEVDVDTAFKHNSCKKIAQLVQVQTAFDGMTLDKDYSKVELRDHADTQIALIYQNHQKKLEELAAQTGKLQVDLYKQTAETYTEQHKKLRKDFSIFLKKINKKMRQLEQYVSSQIDVKEISGIGKEDVFIEADFSLQEPQVYVPSEEEIQKKIDAVSEESRVKIQMIKKTFSEGIRKREIQSEKNTKNGSRNKSISSETKTNFERSIYFL